MAGRGRLVQRLVQQHTAARAFSAVRTPQFAAAVEASGVQGAAASANSSGAVRYARYARQCARLLGATLAALTGAALGVLTEAVVDARAGVCSCWPGNRAHAGCLHALGGSRGPGAPCTASRLTRLMIPTAAQTARRVRGNSRSTSPARPCPPRSWTTRSSLCSADLAPARAPR